MATRRDGRIIRVGTQTRKRCFRCSRPIGQGREHEFNGHYYGAECIHKVVEQANLRALKEK